MLQNYPNTIVLGYPSTGMTSGLKPYQGDSVVSFFKERHGPSAFPDGLGYDANYLDLNDSVASRYTNSPQTPVAIELDSKAWDEVNRQVDLTLSIRNDGADLPGEYWYNVVLTEDSVVFSHVTMPGCSKPNLHYGQPRDTSYVNNWVARKLVYWSQGRYLVGPDWTASQEITHSCSFTIDSAWLVNNCQIIVNVYKKSDSIYQSPVMQAIKFTVTGGLDIKENIVDEDQSISIFPNPASGVVNIHTAIKNAGKYSLGIYDLSGQKVKSLYNGFMRASTFNFEMSVNDLTKGTYIVVLKSSIGVKSEKLVIL